MHLPTLNRLRFPWLYVAEVAMMFPLFGTLAAVMFFLAAHPISELDLGGKTLPASWEAACPNHGRYLRCELISNHPLLFALALFCFFVAGGLTCVLRSAQRRQRAEDGESMRRAHNIANGATFLSFAVISIFVMFIWIGVYPR